jgi:hypothetical protein
LWQMISSESGGITRFHTGGTGGTKPATAS